MEFTKGNVLVFLEKNGSDNLINKFISEFLLTSESKNQRKVEDYLDLRQYQTDEFGDKVTKDENGKWHSYNDKPSLISKMGDKYWHKHGRLHRETGPSLIYSNGKELYYLDNVRYSKENWEKKVAELKKQESQKVGLTQYQINEYGDKFTLDENGKLHSYNDKPSFINTFGDKSWHKHGRIHRETGPAASYSTSYSNGEEYYYLDGVEYFKEDWEKKVAELNK